MNEYGKLGECGSGDNIRMNSVIGVINSNSEALTDRVLDVDPECLEEPMPQPFNWRIMNAAYLQRRRKLVFVELWCICCSENKF